MYKNKAIGICKTREDFFGAYISDIISLWLYFWSYIQNFLYNLDCDYSMINASKIYLYNLFLGSVLPPYVALWVGGSVGLSVCG